MDQLNSPPKLFFYQRHFSQLWTENHEIDNSPHLNKSYNSRKGKKEKKMPSQPPIPHLLSPYLAHSTHSAQSLTIITSVLAATPNWLILRYLHSVLSAVVENYEYGSHQESGSRKKRRRARRVVLVSFLREWSFWRAEGKRLVRLVHF